MGSKRIVHRIEHGEDHQDVMATTYQMRNFYQQFGDGFFSVLDVMNYIQHHQIVRWCKPLSRVLDVCCGRGLLLPLLRYQKPSIIEYVGVDIAPSNRRFLTKRVTDGASIDNDYYPFRVSFVESDVAEMSSRVEGPFDFIVYTSSIEHMHPDHGRASLAECRKLISSEGRLVITCPNTPEDQDGYDTQYRAHVYEWKRSELQEALEATGFKILETWGLLATKKDIQKEMAKLGGAALFAELSKFIPSEWLVPVLAPVFPQVAKEIGFVVEPK